MLESRFKTDLKRELEERLPGCIILPGDSSCTQGIPDILVLYKKRWAALEGKRSLTASKRPNQDYYVEKMNDMSFAAFICPENRVEVLDDLQQALSPRRATRTSIRV